MIDLPTLAMTRVHRSGLVNRFDSVQQCAEALCGIQAQVATVALMSISARTGHSLTQVKHELESGSFVRVWGARDTLHIFTHRQWLAYTSFFGAIPSWFDRKLRRAGVSEEDILLRRERTLAVARRLQRFDRPAIMAATDLRESEWLWSGPLIRLSKLGLIASSFDDGSARTYWTNSHPNADNGESGSSDQIVYQYLSSYGPASEADISHWSGLPVSRIREICARIRDKIVPVEGLREANRRTVLWDIAASHSQRMDEKRCFLLYRFDPLMVAYRNKEWIVTEQNMTRIWTAGGHISPVVIVGGRAIGTWRVIHHKNGCDFHISLFSTRKRLWSSAVESEFAALAQRLERTVHRITWGH